MKPVEESKHRAAAMWLLLTNKMLAMDVPNL
jgi:hypothetical protein